MQDPSFECAQFVTRGRKLGDEVREIAEASYIM